MGSKRTKRIWRIALIGVAVLVVAIQFVPVARTNPPVKSEVSAPPEVAAILQRSCYDCHSNETTWPWYAYVAPVSWKVVGHVDHARKDLNFSEWPTFDIEAQKTALHDIYDEVEEGEMPLPGYVRIHREARLTDDERQIIMRWARSFKSDQ